MTPKPLYEMTPEGEKIHVLPCLWNLICLGTSLAVGLVLLLVALRVVGVVLAWTFGF